MLFKLLILFKKDIQELNRNKKKKKFSNLNMLYFQRKFQAVIVNSILIAPTWIRIL